MPPKKAWKRAALKLTAAASSNAPARRAIRPIGRKLPDRVWMSMRVEDVFDVDTPVGPISYRSTSDDFIGMALYWRGLSSWEHETFPTFIKLCRGARGFLDIGASTGVYSLIAAKTSPTLQAVAFEPVPWVATRTREHVSMNGFQDRITVVEKALGKEAGQAQFFVPAGDTPTGGFLEGSQTPDSNWAKIDVPVTTLADELPADFHVDLIKMDVEGAEGQVIEGMADVLEKHRPHMIVEFLHDGGHERATEVLRSLGYWFEHLNAKGSRFVSEIRPDVETEYRNYLCVPRP